MDDRVSAAASRPSWDLVNCMIVWIISLLATCNRLMVGALLWNPVTKQIIAVGYNGSPSGQPHCIDTGCELEDGHCVNCLHSEDNVFYWAGTASQGCYLYLNYAPCRRCANKIIQGRVSRVIYTQGYRGTGGIDKLQAAGIEVTYYPRATMVTEFLTRATWLGILKST